MKLDTIALATAFALSSTSALAYTNHHHRSGVWTHQGTVGMSSASYRGSMNSYGWNNNGWNNTGWNRGPNNLGGLVGGDDAGTYRP
jgi:hypothetical protein